MAYKINHADILDWAENYDGEPFDGILCDPPYELGFMGKSWDSTGIAFNVELWNELLRICKPGAHLLAFSGSRTYHRMAVAIEDAGFEIRDMIEWVYGSGFPKSLNIGKAVDKIQGNERKIIGKSQHFDKYNSEKYVKNNAVEYAGRKTKEEVGYLTKGTSEWEGYGTALKPAHEPCVLARKPIKGTVANNCLEHGTGGLNIDGTRVELASSDDTKRVSGGHKTSYIGGTLDKNYDISLQANRDLGRFPANLIHDGSDEVLEVFPNVRAGKAIRTNRAKTYNNTSYSIAGPLPDMGYGDSGSAARFFYCAKSSKSERNAGLDGFEEKQKFWHNHEGRDMTNPKNYIGGKVLIQTAKNHHPTVKPLALTKYLANLIKPPKGGRLLVPFSGSGSEMIGALQAGWEYVEGVELTEEYIPIAEARIKYWLDKMDKQMGML